MLCERQKYGAASRSSKVVLGLLVIMVIRPSSRLVLSSFKVIEDERRVTLEIRIVLMVGSTIILKEFQNVFVKRLH